MFSLRNQPLTVIVLGLISLMMLVPALFAARVENWDFARAFLYHAIIFIILTAMLGIGFSNSKLSRMTSRRLADLFIAFATLPLALALPVQALMPQVPLWDLYFEMLSCLTTTGATIFADPSVVPETVHFWRALVAWFGGFLILVIAVAIFQPARLGGFEVYGGQNEQITGAYYIKRADIRARVLRYSGDIFPLYFGCTAILAVLLMVAGMRSFSAVVHAMGIFSTSGISLENGAVAGGAGTFGEIFMFFAMMAAVSRFSFQQDVDGRGFKNLKSDKEINLMLACIVIIPTALFLRHWISALDLSSDDSFVLAVQAFWGSVFMVLSFLTTTGYESVHWESAQNWSGLGASTTVLIGLCIMGGGIATTAGGVKLLRIYALYKHGRRELQRLSYPSSVMGAGRKARSIRREGAYIAWVFVMLFLVSLALLLLCYTFDGIPFEDGLLLAVSGLSTTGPLLLVVGENGLHYAEISNFSKGIFAVSMILGRLEVLAVIAVISPTFWER